MSVTAGTLARLAWAGDSRRLSAAVLAAVRAAVDAGDLAVPVPESVRIERPKVKEHGDYATSIALQLAKPAGVPPREVAEAIAGQLRQAPGVATVDVAGPGFLNITLDSAAQGELARTIVTAGEAYGRTATHGRSPVQPGVRLGQPDRPAAPRPRPVGSGRRRARPGARGQRRRRGPGVLLQRRRRADRPVRRSRCSPRPRASRRRRTATAATTSARSRRRSWRRHPDVLDARRRRGARRSSAATAST